jgi:tetratricopeptide (TPR) repeat protein
MNKGKTLALAGAAVLTAAIAAALLAPPRRIATTSSAEAYREYLAGQEDIHRIYMGDAERHMTAALRHDPQFVMAMVSLAEIKLFGDPAAARTWLARANGGRDRVTRRERLALDLMRAWSQRRLDDAARIATLLKNDYHDERGYNFLGNLASERGQIEDANAIYREWLASNPNNAAPYNLLGYSAAYRGDYGDAISNLKKYAFLAPDEANPFDSLGEIEAANGRYEDAIRDLRKALAIKPDFYPSLGHLGVAYTGEGDFAAAREALEAAERGYANSPGQRLLVLWDLAYLAHRQKDLDFERAVVGRAAAIDLGRDASDQRPLLRAVLASDEGRYDEALADWNAYAPPAVGDEKTRNIYRRAAGRIRGLIEFQAGHFAEAAPWLEKSLPEAGREASLPDQAGCLRARAYLARVKARQGDVAAAEALLTVNRRFNPRHPETREAAAEISGGRKGA